METSNFITPESQFVGNKRLLIVEDKRSTGEALMEMLGMYGHKVSLVCSGREAVTKVLSESESIDAILMDISMPGEIDGIDAVCEIQKASFSRIQIIFVTAFADDKVYQQRVIDENLKILGWIDKPIVGPNEKKLHALIAKGIMRKEILGQIENQLWKGMPSRMIQEFLKELISKYGITSMVETVKEMERIAEANPLKSVELLTHLNFIAYQNKRMELERDFSGQFVAFLEGEMVGHKADRDDLIREVYQKYKRTDIFITKITKEKGMVKLRRPRRVIR